VLETVESLCVDALGDVIFMIELRRVDATAVGALEPRVILTRVFASNEEENMVVFLFVLVVPEEVVEGEVATSVLLRELSLKNDRAHKCPDT
jgi:hypothetical protein